MEVVGWRKVLGRLMVRKKRATSQEERQPEGEALRARTEVYRDHRKRKAVATPP